jgi:hypothetical protein
MYGTGIAKPVYITSRSRIIELGARACAIVFVIDAKSLKNMLIDSVIVKATSMKKKNGPGSRRRLAMTENTISSEYVYGEQQHYLQYSVELTTIELVIL